MDVRIMTEKGLTETDEREESSAHWRNYFQLLINSKQARNLQ